MRAFEPPHWTLAALWLLWVLQALWCWYNARVFHTRIGRWVKRVTKRMRFGDLYAPPAAVIVPVKGCDTRFEEHLNAMMRQDYPRYRLIYVVEAASDPAHAAIRRAQQRLPEGSSCESIRLLVAGPTERGGQKVHNLLHALDDLTGADEAIAFADADTVPGPLWLSRLVQPLERERVGAVTGYRWLVPTKGERAGLPTQLASLINGSIATLQGPARRNHVWGGSCALRRETLEAIGLRDWWDGALSDDYQLTRALSAAGKEVRFDPRLLVASPVRFTWGSLLEFGRRQYLITRVHTPWLWLTAVAFTLPYVAALLATILAAVMQLPGWGWGLVALGVVAGAGVRRAMLRRRVAEAVLDGREVAALRRAFRLDAVATPVVMAVHLLLILAGGCGRRMTWGGITYDLNGPRDVRIVHRPEPPPGEPTAEAPG